MRSQGLAYLQVAVAAARAAPAFAQVTPGRAVEEVAVVVAAAVLFQDVPHLRLEERHVHVDRHHLQDTPEDTHPVWAHAAGLSNVIFGTKHDTQPGCAHAIPAHYINKKRVPHDELRSAWNSALELRNLQVLRLYEHGPVGWTQTQWGLKFFRYLDVWAVTADLELCRNKKLKMHEVKSCRNNLWRMHRKCFKAQTERNELNQHRKGFIITENRWC